MARESKVRYKVKIENGKLKSLVQSEPIPRIRSGAVVEVIILKSDLVDGSKKKAIGWEKIGPVLDAGEILTIRLRQAEKMHLRDDGPLETRDGIQNIKVRLLQSLYFLSRGDARKSMCSDCKCELLLGSEKRMADSLNEAYTIASSLYEPKRRSHAGNVFREIFYTDKKGGEQPVENLR